MAPVFRFLLNARQCFPYSPPSLLTRDWDWGSSPDTTAALHLLPESEQASVQRYYHASDFALSLGSHLLKHLVIARYCNVPWADSSVESDPAVLNGRPFFRPGGIDFNVSHHGELVVLAGCTRSGARVGIDVVKVDLERDRRGLAREGSFVTWTRVFHDAFSDHEMETFARAHADDTQLSGDELTRARLRVFYAHWACKEAYLKMTGEALGADFLRELEFTTVTVPDPSVAAENVPGAGGSVTTTRVTKYGDLVPGVRVEIQAIGKDYMVATAVHDEDSVAGLKKIDLDSDILTFAPP